MNNLSDALQVTAGGMQSQAARLRVLSENIANADTPGYRRKTITFDEAFGSSVPGVIEPGPVRLSQGELSRVYDPGHPLADGTGYYESSNVNLLVEIADAREAGRSYEANIKLFDQIRNMSSSLMELLRR